MKNYLPEVPSQRGDDTPSEEVYRQLGIMAMLDIDYWQGQSELPISDYLGQFIPHLKARSFLIKLNEERQPIGYAMWDPDPENPSCVRLKRQAAPFGDHLALQRALIRRLPEGTIAKSLHPRSSREEQVAWP